MAPGASSRIYRSFAERTCAASDTCPWITSTNTANLLRRRSHLLQDLRGRRRRDHHLLHRLNKVSTGFPQRVIRSLGVEQDRSVQDDQPRRPRSRSSSSSRSATSGSGMSGASRTR